MTRMIRLVILVLAMVAPAAAQQSITTASVTGRVVDPSGAPVPAAVVSARSADRNQLERAETAADGRFRFLALSVGSYEFTVSAKGFVPSRVTATLRVGEALDLPFRLEVAGITASVEVVTEAPLVETRRTQVADAITPGHIDTLPLNGRNYLDLALLAPGVSRTIQRNTERFAETSAVPGTGISFGGQRNLNNTYIVDGLSANDDAAGLAGTYFAEEVIREFQVVTSGGIAEFGRASSGIVNVVTQSGANTLRGRAYGFFRDDALDARNAMATREDPLNQAQFGLTLSGPIATDRTFWFANAERTDLERTGIITISAANVDTVNRVLDSVAYPGPRIARGEFPTGHDTINLFGRVDHSADARSRLTARYSLYDVTSENARSVGGLNAVSRGTALEARDQTGAVGWTATLSSASLNEFRAQATRSRLAAPPNDIVGPAVSIAGVANFGTSTTSPTGRDLDFFEISDSYTLQRDRHLLKAGGVFLYERLDIEFPGALQGTYTFASLANFQAGRYVNFQQAFGEPSQFQTNPNLGFFVQDEWRPRNDLTVNAGLRYDLQWLEDPVSGDSDNVSPRVGIAFAPGDGRTVMRASGGLYFDRIPLRAVSNALQRDGVKYRVGLLTSGQPGAPIFPAVLGGFPAGVLTNITSIDPGIDSGLARQATLQIERQVGRNVSVAAGCSLLVGRQIIMSRNANVPTLPASAGDANLGRPDPRFANNGQFQSIGQSRYDGLTLSLKADRFRRATLRLAYTLSKSLDDAGNAFFSSPQDNFNVHDDWGRSDNDQRHRFVASGTARLFAGLEFAGLFSYASAPPFNIQTGTDRNGDTTANDRPPGVGRNTGEGFDSATLDIRLSRAFALGGSHRLDAMVEAFNVLNRTNFLIPNNTFGPGTTPLPSFGEPTAAGDARQIQIGLRWTF